MVLFWLKQMGSLSGLGPSAKSSVPNKHIIWEPNCKKLWVNFKYHAQDKGVGSYTHGAPNLGSGTVY